MKRKDLDYNYRVHTGLDYFAFGKGSIKEDSITSCFSMNKVNKAEGFTIIERPPIPELDDFIDRYMDDGYIENKQSKKRIRKFLGRR